MQQIVTIKLNCLQQCAVPFALVLIEKVGDTETREADGGNIISVNSVFDEGCLIFVSQKKSSRQNSSNKGTLMAEDTLELITIKGMPQHFNKSLIFTKQCVSNDHTLNQKYQMEKSQTSRTINH